MAITINTTPNTSDTSTSLSISFSGATTGTNITTSFQFRINGVVLSTLYSTASSGTVVFSPANVKSSIWANAYGNSLSSIVSIRASNYRTSDNTIYGTTTKTGALTINTRLTNFTNNGANINLDGNSYIKGSWTNPNTTYFRGYFVATMSGGTVGSAGGQNTYYDYSVNPGTAWYNNANSFLGTASSATITYTLYTQFYTNAGWSTQGGSVGSYTGTVTKTQYTYATLSSVSDYTVEPGMQINYSAQDGSGGTGLSYSAEIRINSVKIFGRGNLSTVGSSLTPTTDEVNALYVALANTPSATSQLAIATYVNGTWKNEVTATSTAYNVIASIISFINTERAGTSLSFSWETNTQVDQVDYKLGSGAWVNIVSGLELTSGTFQITGLNASTAYSVTLRVKHPTSDQFTTSSTINVSTVNTSIISNTPNFDIKAGATISITISKIVSTMLHNIYLKSSDELTTYETITNVDASGVITLSPTTLNTFYSLTANSSTLNLFLVCESILNGVSQGTTKKAIVGTVTDSLPTVGGATYLDINPTIQAILLNDQKILQSRSTLKVTATNMNAINSATLASLTVVVGSAEYSVPLSGTSVGSQEITIGTVDVDSLTSVIVKVIDSRGIASAPLDVPIQFIPYKVPSYVEVEIQRLNNYYADAYFRASYEINSVITSAIQRNSVSIAYRFKLKSDSVWGAWVPVDNPTPTVSGDKLRYEVDIYAGPDFDMTAVYSVEARISDTFTTTPIIYTSYIPKGMGHIEFYEDYVNFGVQPYFTDSESVEHQIIHEANLALVLQVVYPVGSIYISTNATNPATLFGFGTWSAFAQGRTLIGVGTSDQAFTAGATGGESEHTLTGVEVPVHNTVMTATTSTTEVAVNSYSADGAPHNNLPPYIVTYMWQRTA